MTKLNAGLIENPGRDFLSELELGLEVLQVLLEIIAVSVQEVVLQAAGVLAVLELLELLVRLQVLGLILAGLFFKTNTTVTITT